MAWTILLLNDFFSTQRFHVSNSKNILFTCFLITFCCLHLALFFPAVSDKPLENQGIRDVNHYYAFNKDPDFHFLSGMWMKSIFLNALQCQHIKYGLLTGVWTRHVFSLHSFVLPQLNPLVSWPVLICLLREFCRRAARPLTGGWRWSRWGWCGWWTHFLPLCSKLFTRSVIKINMNVKEGKSQKEEGNIWRKHFVCELTRLSFPSICNDAMHLV